MSAFHTGSVGHGEAGVPSVRFSHGGAVTSVRFDRFLGVGALEQIPPSMETLQDQLLWELLGAILQSYTECDDPSIRTFGPLTASSQKLEYFPGWYPNSETDLSVPAAMTRLYYGQ